MNKILHDPAYFFVFFVFFWLGIMVVIAKLGGWGKLAAVYRAGTKPEGKTLRFQSGNFGLANYKGCLTYIVNREGVYISVFFVFRFMHPPLFIPWRDILNQEEKKYFWIRLMKVDIGQPKLTTAYFPAKVFEEVY